MSLISDRSVIAVTDTWHGLGNRLRVVLGARSLATFTGREFAYTWPTGKSFGLGFDELWDFPERSIPTVLSKALSLRHPYRDAKLEWMPGAQGDRIWQIKTAHALTLPEGSQPWESLLQGLVPEASLAARIHDFYNAHLIGRPYIGVSIRTAKISHELTRKHSPVEWYLERMAAIREINPDIAFFLSADTEETQRRIIDAIPDTYALRDKGPFNSPTALRACVMEFYLLGASTHILGSYYSSYPETAQKLAGPSLLLETSMTDAATKWDATHPPMIAPDPLRPHIRAAV